jgi:hypothetical protein
VDAKTDKGDALDVPVLVAVAEEAEDPFNEAAASTVVMDAKPDAAAELPGLTELVATAFDAEVELAAKTELKNINSQEEKFKESMIRAL